MPEGPEIRVSAEYLNFYLSHSILTSVDVLGGKFAHTPIKGLHDVIFPLEFESVTSKGKMLIFTFKNCKMKMFSGLGMTGQFIISREKHSHLRFNLSSNPLIDRIFFDDVRSFGNVAFSIDDLSSKLAPDIFTITDDEFIGRSMIKTKMTVLSVLMNQQKVVSGIGNYLVAEVLYRSKVSPHRPFLSLTRSELLLIRRSAFEIGMAAFEYEGTSVRDFILPNGYEGQYAPFLCVYGRKETPTGEKITREMGSHKRTIWWVPSVQI